MLDLSGSSSTTQLYMLTSVSAGWLRNLLRCFLFSWEVVVAGNREGVLSWKNSGMQGFLVYILPEYAAGAGFAPPSFFRPDVIVACVFYE